jgi:hypothetical protein
VNARPRPNENALDKSKGFSAITICKVKPILGHALIVLVSHHIKNRRKPFFHACTKHGFQLLPRHYLKNLQGQASRLIQANTCPLPTWSQCRLITSNNMPMAMPWHGNEACLCKAVPMIDKVEHASFCAASGMQMLFPGDLFCGKEAV